MPDKKVLIIGGGIGGLAIAHGLKKNGIPFHIYERDAGKDFRAQGYRIRVARDAVGSIQYLFDQETWKNFELTCADTRLAPIAEIDAETGKVNMPKVDDAGPPPDAAKPYTVDRTVFRDVMLRDLGDHISYGKTLERFEESTDGKDDSVQAIFTDGSSVSGSLLIGADGAHSKVRNQLVPDLQSVPTGGVCVYGKTELTQEVTEKLEPAVLRGMGALKDRSHDKYSVTVMEPVVFGNRSEMENKGFNCPKDYLYWVLSAQPDALGLEENPNVSNDEAADLTNRISRNWHQSISDILTKQQPGSTAVLPIRSVPSDFGRFMGEPNARVTMIGDAIHVMGPTSGSGAIVALRDAYALCKLLVEDGFDDLKITIGKYEAEMREYASNVVATSWKTGEFIFGQTRDNDQNIGEVMIANRKRTH